MPKQRLDAGVSANQIWLDPGFGFSKNVQHNLDLLQGLEQITALGYPVLFGISRKRVVDYLLGAIAYRLTAIKQRRPYLPGQSKRL